jgi:SAM-dependent methyltransferase
MRHAPDVHWDKIAGEMDVDIRRFYASYPGQSVLAALQDLLPSRLDGARVLDVGCGTGRYFLFFAQLGAAYRVGVDVGSNLLAACHHRNPGVGLAKASAVSLPFADESFDVVMSMGVIEHFPDPAPMLDELVRVIRPGGQLILETPNAANLVFSLYKIVNAKKLTWERWLGPWNLRQMVEGHPSLNVEGFRTAILASWVLSRVVSKASRLSSDLPTLLVAIERSRLFRYLGSLMFVSARRRRPEG